MKKNYVLKTMLTLLVVSSQVAFSSTVYGAEESYDTNTTKSQGHTGTTRSTTITPFILNELRTLSHGLTLKYWLNNEIRADQMATNFNPSINSEEGNVSINNDMTINDGDTLAAHEAILDNNTPIDQTLNAAAFEYSQDNTVTTQTSHTTGANLTTTAEMRFPIASASVSLSALYEFNHTNAVSTSETWTWTVPSQAILVPAGRKYAVNWVLEQGVATGTVNLKSRVQGSIPYRINGLRPIGTALREDDRLSNTLSDQGIGHPIFNQRSEWEATNNSTAERTVGTATYRAQYGTRLVMAVTDITDANNPVKLREEVLNIVPEKE
ncbi:hypothetical protein C1940_03500 [Lactiplantibacillus plantarum subsp. plantarum]|uniref:ETX/MTX2 family pore-forming toxin n=1 Tax=Lactiplantibacillus plantarum TaxID=1590 RepID=UPI000CD351F0|nr:ETX/MTX2 family pore-forming toxin [Lactiplantibacillus plantarum]AUV71588.1 hypothetical protein C1940_03500 [Lactiplantibacillus plantarum subsp. plantarum]